ncbi:MAG TPA: DUF4157 domain-containing protein [Pyrinomonadaceae bacterium]|jgi:hypothetical protein|nr:DUF4157 domain-containing protein [Pyrinomonadaceae bacterium]
MREPVKSILGDLVHNMFAPRSTEKRKATADSQAQPDKAVTAKPSSATNPIWQTLVLPQPALQTKLTIGQAGDAYEREADQIADRVMRMPETISDEPVSTGAPPAVQRKCDECEDEEKPKIQRKEQSGADAPTFAPPLVHQTLKRPGQPLDLSVRLFFEQRFGHQLPDVRVHADTSAAQSASAVNARAYTVGSDIVFGARQYEPSTNDGKRLLAHELAHSLQQVGGPRSKAQSESPAISAGPTRLSRVPQPDFHEDMIEQYRRENGFPPHGINPITGQQEGPTDADLKFGGLLDAWLRNRQATPPAGAPATQPQSAPTPTPQPASPAAQPQQSAAVRNVPAPGTVPTITPVGTTNVVAACGTGAGMPACRAHQSYVQNIMPQAIANIRAVRSPYSTAIADLYAATLPIAQAAAAPIASGTPGTPFGRTVDCPAPGPVTVTFGGTTFTFQRFSVGLQQFVGGANGRAMSIGGPLAFILLNESSNDAMVRNIAGVEETMIHETTHVLMSIVEAANQRRAPGASLTERNLDRTSYATIETSLEAALLPFITQVRALPSFTGSPPAGTPRGNATATANSFLSEVIARAEAGIFIKQRAGQAFTAADLRTLPPFFRSPEYWSPTPPLQTEMVNFLTTNQTQIDTAIQPLIFQAGEMYLNLRP